MLLEIKNLSIEFHDHNAPEKVLNDISFSMEDGEILGIVGESGSGKSMTAMAVAGLLPRKKMEKKGEIYFNGEELLFAGRNVLRRLQGKAVSVIFQEPMTALNPTMKIGRQVEEALRVHERMSKTEMKERALEYLKKVELNDVEGIYNAYPHELSGGMRQRVMIAAALIAGPRLLIADEPTTALDVTVQADIIKLLKKINREEETAILFISHDLSLVKELCDNVLVMQNGIITERGKAKDVFANPTHPYTRRLVDAIPVIDMN